MATVYTEIHQKIGNITSLQLCHNQQDNSNLIMPFLVQNDKNDYSPNYTNQQSNRVKTNEDFFFLNPGPYYFPHLHKALLCDCVTQRGKANL